MAEDLTQRKLLSGLAHGAIFFSATVVAVGIPIAIYLISDDPVVKENAQESLNFHFNVWLYGVIFGLLIFVGIGFILLGVLWFVSILAPIVAIAKILSDSETVFRYPFIFRLL